MFNYWAQFKNPLLSLEWNQMVILRLGAISFLQESVGDVLFYGEDAG